jgi:hypothetical protein
VPATCIYRRTDGRTDGTDGENQEPYVPMAQMESCVLDRAIRIRFVPGRRHSCLARRRREKVGVRSDLDPVSTLTAAHTHKPPPARGESMRRPGLGLCVCVSRATMG